MSWRTDGAIELGPVDHVVWLVVLGDGDTTHRWISGRLGQLVDGATRMSYRSGAAVDDFVDEAGEPSSLVVAVDGTDMSMPSILATLAELRLEVSLVPVVDGVGSFSGRLVVQAGRVSDCELDDALTLTMTCDPDDLVDASDWAMCGVVDARTWPLSDEDKHGRRYPLPYGRPGGWRHETTTGQTLATSYSYTEVGWPSTVTWTPARASRTSGATPVLAVEREIIEVELPSGATITGRARVSILLLSGRRVAASTVEVWARSPDSSKPYARELEVLDGYDGLGRPVSILDITDESPEFRDAGEWWAAFSESVLVDTANGGGWAPTDTAARGGLGSLVEEVLRFAEVPVDEDATRAAAVALDAYRLGGYVGESPVSAVTWCSSRLGQVGWVMGRTGRGVTPRPRWPRVVTATLELGRDAIVMGPVRYIRATSSAVAVVWAQDAFRSGRVRSVIIDAASSRATADAARLQERDELSAPECWDEATALAIGETALLDRAGGVELEVQVSTKELGWLRAGDLVDLTATTNQIHQLSGLFVITGAVMTDRPWRSLRLRSRPPVVARTLRQEDDVGR